MEGRKVLILAQNEKSSHTEEVVLVDVDLEKGGRVGHFMQDVGDDFEDLLLFEDVVDYSLGHLIQDAEHVGVEEGAFELEYFEEVEQPLFELLRLRLLRPRFMR